MKQIEVLVDLVVLEDSKTLYYVSFHGVGSVCTRCFDTETERDKFANRVKNPIKWERRIT